MNGLPHPAYVMSEPHLSGYRVIIGYETLADAQAAQLALSKPQAREDAQPVAKPAPFDQGGIGHAMYQAFNAYLADYVLSTDGDDYVPTPFERDLIEDFFAGLMAEEAFFGPVRALYDTHPAPDALRVAVEALEGINRIRSEMVGVPVDSEAASAWASALDAAADRATEALAALQAEQKGGAVDGPEDDELPGDFLARVGMDGALWADGFRKMALKLGYSDMDEGWLIGWFCNAVMAGYDHAQRRFDPAPATREEAPAEAGEREAIARIIAPQTFDLIASYTSIDRGDGLTPDQREPSVFKAYPTLETDRDQALAKADAILALRAKPPAREDALREHERLFKALRDQSWDLRCFDIPTGGDDYDIGWRVVGHWQAEPRERTIAEVFTDDPAEAVRQALATLQAEQGAK